jgi:hypothetical protein
MGHFFEKKIIIFDIFVSANFLMIKNFLKFIVIKKFIEICKNLLKISKKCQKIDKKRHILHGPRSFAK